MNAAVLTPQRHSWSVYPHNRTLVLIELDVGFVRHLGRGDVLLFLSRKWRWESESIKPFHKNTVRDSRIGI